MIYYKEEILKETQNIVFFDIDQTLSSSTDFHYTFDEDKLQNYKKSLYNKQWKTIKLFDFQCLNQTSLALFACFLRQTNSKAVCVSSWNTTRPEIAHLYFKELKESFEVFSSLFPDNWLLGFSGCGGGDRHTHSIIPFLKETNFKEKYIAIDDSGISYKDHSYCVIVDGKTAFHCKEYLEGLKLFGLEEEIMYPDDLLALDNKS